MGTRKVETCERPSAKRLVPKGLCPQVSQQPHWHQTKEAPANLCESKSKWSQTVIRITDDSFFASGPIICALASVKALLWMQFSYSIASGCKTISHDPAILNRAGPFPSGQRYTVTTATSDTWTPNLSYGRKYIFMLKDNRVHALITNMHRKEDIIYIYIYVEYVYILCIHIIYAHIWQTLDGDTIWLTVDLEKLLVI